MKNFALRALLLVLALGIYASANTKTAESAVQHLDGSVIVSAGTAYKIENNTLRPFPSAAVFQSCGYSFNNLAQATANDLSLSRGPLMNFCDGALVNDGGTVYMVSQGNKYAYGSAAAFTGHGFSFGSLLAGSISNFNHAGVITSGTFAHPPGSIVLANGTLWWIREGGRSAFPSWGVYTSYGFRAGQWANANASDLSLPIFSMVVARSNGGVVQVADQVPQVPQTPQVPQVPTTPQAPVGCNTGDISAEFLCILNNYRAENGKNALVYEAALSNAALAHSTWMNQTGNFSHTGVNGSAFYERCQAAGTTCDGENLVMGATSAQHMFDLWRNSPGHNANMLGNHTVMGLGISGAYATNVFR